MGNRKRCGSGKRKKKSRESKRSGQWGKKISPSRVTPGGAQVLDGISPASKLRDEVYDEESSGLVAADRNAGEVNETRSDGCR